MDTSAAVPGVDLSTYDSPVDYDRLVGAVRWAILRVGDGGAHDSAFLRHAAGVAGRLPLGTYLFGRPSRDPHRQVIEWAEKVLTAMEAGASFPLGHWLDLERAEVSPVLCTAWVADVLAMAEGAGLGRLGIYCSPAWWVTSIVPGFDPSPAGWWVPRYPWQTAKGQPIGEETPVLPSVWPRYVTDRAAGRVMAPAPRGAATAIWQFSSLGYGPGVGTQRDRSLDCNLMAAEVFARLTSPADQVTPPVVSVPSGSNVVLDLTPQEDDDMKIVRRAAAGGPQDPRLYKTNGIWKERIGDGGPGDAQAWADACADFGLPAGSFEDMDAGRVNRMRDVGPDPVG